MDSYFDKVLNPTRDFEMNHLRESRSPIIYAIPNTPGIFAIPNSPITSCSLVFFLEVLSLCQLK